MVLVQRRPVIDKCSGGLRMLVGFQPSPYSAQMYRSDPQVTGQKVQWDTRQLVLVGHQHGAIALCGRFRNGAGIEIDVVDKPLLCEGQ